MVYRRGHKLCADCANPDFIRVMDLGFGAMGPDMAAAVGPVCERYLMERYGVTFDGLRANSQTISPRPSVSTADETRAILASMGQSLKRWAVEAPAP